MNLSGRERNLLIALGIVVVLMAVWFVFLRPSTEPIVIDEILPSVTPSVVVSPGAEGTGAGGTVSPSFVIPADARDPFRS